MEKPRPKKEVAIDWIGRSTGMIFFDASADAVEDLHEFGKITPLYANHYVLVVDARYDFDEIVEFIEDY